MLPLQAKIGDRREVRATGNIGMRTSRAISSVDAQRPQALAPRVSKMRLYPPRAGPRIDRLVARETQFGAAQGPIE